MEIKKLSCPHCGASVNIDLSKQISYCIYCGGQIIIDDQIKKTSNEETVNKNVNVDIKKENVNTTNNLAEIEKAKNEGFLNKYKFILIFSGAAIVIVLITLVIILSIIHTNQTKSTTYNPSSKDKVEIDKHTSAEFIEVVMGKLEQKSLLIVSEQEANTLINITKEGWFNWGIFEKNQEIREYGIIQYTVDLSQIKQRDIVYDEDNNTITVYVPAADIHDIVLEPDKREVGDPDNGFFAWGNIKITEEQSAKLETEALAKLKEVAQEENDISTIDKDTKEAVENLLEACISKVDNSTKLIIEIDR